MIKLSNPDAGRLRKAQIGHSEQLDNDIVFKVRDITYLIEKELFDQAKPIKVDFVESFIGSGFQLTSSLSAGGGCSC